MDLVVKSLILEVIQSSSIIQEVMAMGAMTSTIVEPIALFLVASSFRFATSAPLVTQTKIVLRTLMY